MCIHVITGHMYLSYYVTHILCVDDCWEKRMDFFLEFFIVFCREEGEREGERERGERERERERERE